MRPTWTFFISCTLLVPALATADNRSNRVLPPQVHPTFVKAIQNADEAANGRDYQKAQALLKGVLYPDGVTVKLDEGSALDQKSRAIKATNRAVETWHQRLGGDSPIRLVSNTAKADLTIVLVNKVPSSSHDALGLIELQKQYRWNNVRHEVINSGTIWVQRTWDGKYLNEDELTEVICHELGHLLGLADVDQVGTLMGPMVMGKPTLTPAPHEVDALKKLRHEARVSLNRIQAVASILNYGINNDWQLSQDFSTLLNSRVTCPCHKRKE